MVPIEVQRASRQLVAETYGCRCFERPDVASAAQSIVMAHCPDARAGVYWARVPFTRRNIRMASHKKGKGSPSRTASTHVGGQAASARKVPNSGQTSGASQSSAAV